MESESESESIFEAGVGVGVTLKSIDSAALDDIRCCLDHLPLRFVVSDIGNAPYRKTAKLYDVTVTSSLGLQPPNFLQIWPRYSFEAMPSFSFVSLLVSEIFYQT